MATKKRTTDDKPASAALRHGAAADGAKRWLQPGFAFTTDDDVAFALGYPRLSWLAADRPAGKSMPFKNMALGRWPRNLAAAATRLLFANDWVDALDDTHRAAAPLTDDEATALARDVVGAESRQFIYNALLLAEAQVGPGPLVAGTVEGFEQLSSAKWDRHSPTRLGVLHALRYLLLRVPSAVADDARARLTALAAGHGDQGCAHQLRALLDGSDEPRGAALVAKLRASPPDKYWGPDARRVFLGGDQVLDIERRCWKKYGADRDVLDQYGRIRSPALLPVLLDMSGRSKATKDVTAWFAAHAEHARPFLEERAAGKGDEAGWARALLAAL